MFQHAKKVFSKSKSRSKGSDGRSSSVGSIFQGTVQSRERQLLGCMEAEQAEQLQAEEQQAEQEQAEGQMDVDAEEEARADAELATTHAANPMMDGAETGGPSSSAGTIRFRKTVSIRARCNPADRSVIVLAGDRSWREAGWTGVGHRTPVNSALGAYCRFYYPGMVTLPNGDRVAAHKWEHWWLKQHVDGNDQGLGIGTFHGAVWKGFWERYRLDGKGDYEKEKMAKRKLHLEAEEYVQGEINWIMKDPEAWRWICNHWAGSDFQGASDRNRGNRTSKLGMQRFGADGFIGKEQRMEAKTSVKPNFVEVYIEGHKGSDPNNPEVLCDEQVKYKENVIQRHGPEFDWRAATPDVEAIYEAGGGLRHGRWGLGDGALEYDRIPRPQRTSQGSSSRRPSRAQQEAQQEETSRLQEETRKLRKNDDYMMTYLMTNSNSFISVDNAMKFYISL
ncbi:hypothetical protein U9M48_003129 [Paspalum notatum var. saurae]|uniref:Uncharacterized protein n=1 Tax=Paspalum notatum var. saurae TaxID=547442 RepID=A0AAQ3PI48_PASNO